MGNVKRLKPSDWCALFQVVDKVIVDLGCGGGILGLGACVLGCGHCIGVDIDGDALEIAMRNREVRVYTNTPIPPFPHRYRVLPGHIS